MREIIFGLVAALLLSSGCALDASPTNDLAGNWIGTLDTQPTKLRLVLRINKLAGGPLAATLDSIDQNIRDIPVSAVTVTGNKIRLEAKAIHATYEATLNPAGTILTGQWRQGGEPLSLTLERQPATAAAPGTEAVPLDFKKQLAVLPDDQYVRSILQRWIDQEKRGVGLAVGIFDANGFRVITCGQSGNPARPQVDGDTLFEIGSITKVFTATLLADMVERGEVSLDDTLRQGLPATLRFHSPSAGDIKLRQLATHTSGLPRLPDDPAFSWSMIRDPSNPYLHESACGATPRSGFN
jgi:hypothetical protein